MCCGRRIIFCMLKDISRLKNRCTSSHVRETSSTPSREIKCDSRILAADANLSLRLPVQLNPSKWGEIFVLKIVFYVVQSLQTRDIRHTWLERQQQNSWRQELRREGDRRGQQKCSFFSVRTDPHTHFYLAFAGFEGTTTLKSWSKHDYNKSEDASRPRDHAGAARLWRCGGSVRLQVALDLFNKWCWTLLPKIKILLILGSSWEEHAPIKWHRRPSSRR